jgi:O-antigen/teichoic acid export membrane protein
LGIGVQLVSVPIVWDVLGAAGFGACVFLLALGRWVGLIDIGFHDGTQRQLTQAFDANDERRGFSVWHTFRSLLFFHATVGFLLFLLLSQVPYIAHLVGGTHNWPLFVAAGATFAGQYLFFGASIYFNSRRHFGYLAISNGSQILLSAVLALALTVWLRRPEAYLAGFAVGNGLVALYNFGTASRQASSVADVRKFDRDAFMYSFRFGRKLYLTRVATVVTSTFDRMLVTKALGLSSVTHYNSAARIPEAGQEILPVNQTILPDLTKAHSEGKAEFARVVEKNTLTVLSVACGAILVPCAFSQPVLRLWLGDKFVPEMAWVMLLLGAYAALQVFFSSLALSMIANESPEKVLPFTLYNAVLLLALAYPAAVAYGIIGVAALRLAINVLQFCPIIVFTRNTVVPDVDVGAWLGRLAGTFLLAGLFAFGAVETWNFGSDWMALALIPAFSLGYLVVCHTTKLSPLPDSVVRRLNKLRKPHGQSE